MLHKNIIFWELVVVFVMAKEKLTYMNLEHPVIDFFDTKYLSNITVSCRRYNRANPVHYCKGSLFAHYQLGNNVTIDIYLYEFLSNRYQRGFVELHFKLCEITDNPFFGPMLQKFLPAHCPYPAGYYSVVNFTVIPAAIPKGFPFTKGRAYVNASLNKDIMTSGHVDMELRTTYVDKKLFFF